MLKSTAWKLLFHSDRFCPYKAKKQTKITMQNNTYCSRIKVAFSDTNKIETCLDVLRNFPSTILYLIC